MNTKQSPCCGFCRCRLEALGRLVPGEQCWPGSWHGHRASCGSSMPLSGGQGAGENRPHHIAPHASINLPPARCERRRTDHLLPNRISLQITEKIMVLRAFFFVCPLYILLLFDWRFKMSVTVEVQGCHPFLTLFLGFTLHLQHTKNQKVLLKICTSWKNKEAFQNLNARLPDLLMMPGIQAFHFTPAATFSINLCINQLDTKINLQLSVYIYWINIHSILDLPFARQTVSSD